MIQNNPRTSTLLVGIALAVAGAGCGGSPEASTETFEQAEAVTPSSVKINFQPAAAIVPTGYLVDSGSVFGARVNGLSFGWNSDNTTFTRERNSTLSPDQRYDTFNHLQKPGGATVWELAVDNGTYDVHVASGDATQTDSVFKILAEGALVVNGTPTTAAHWIEGTVRVTVTDGRLTVSNAAGAVNNKIDYIDVTRVTTTTGLARSADRLVYTDVSGGAASAAQTLTLTNTGTTAVSLTSLALSGAAASSFAITSAPALPASVAAGAKVTVGVHFNPTTVGVKKASLAISVSGSAVANVALRGLSVAGTGGANEPSLQRILDTLDLPIVAGDPTPDTTDFPSTSTPLAGEEISLQRFVKAGAGNVVIEPLAAFGVASTPVVRFGTYPAGVGSNKTERFTIAPANAQQLLPPVTGTLAFDPGTAPFGVYTIWPSFGNREVFSEDGLNTFAAAGARHYVRVYPLKDAAGAVVPNAYVVTYEEFTTAFDFNDLVLIVRNIKNPVAGAALSLENLDGVPYANRLITSRLLNETTGQLFHNQSTVRVSSSGTSALTINSLATTGPFAVVSPPALPVTLAAGAFLDVTIDLLATGGSGRVLTGSLAIGSNAVGTPSTIVELAGARTQPEGGNEPSLAQLVSAFGYTTTIVGAGQALNGHGSVSAVGDEVLSKYWHALNPSAPVVVDQLAAYHGRPNTATVSWFAQGSSSSNAITVSSGLCAQTLLPRKNGSTTLPSRGSFTNTGVFGFKVDGESSDDTKNNSSADIGNGCVAPCGHHVRFWPVKDRAGVLVPGAYIMSMDYSGINYDYQDNIYLIRNIAPQ